jgi:ABC-type sugar transport system ATPase subunit
MVPILEARELSKSFPGVQALESVSFTVRSGLVHAVTGENGAGKSTLMNILSGLQRPDSGQILFRGQPVQLSSPHEALQVGISMIHQELLPFLELTVAENIWTGREPTTWFPGWVDKAAMNREAARLLERLGVPSTPTRRMKDLSIAEMQLVEIARALACDTKVIIMDEPTSAISEREVRRLSELIRDLKRRGVAVIYVSHKLEEILRLADVVTVLRDGRLVATAEVAGLTADRLIALMVGRELESPARHSSAGSEPLLEVNGLGKPGSFRDVGFTVRRGEILGIAGLMGAGRTGVIHAICGIAPATFGEIRVAGQTVRIRSPRDAISSGIAAVTEDRRMYGLVPEMSLKNNLTLSSLNRCARGWIIDHGAEAHIAQEQIRAFSIRTRDAGLQARFLSGGNQQKAVIAKALLTDPSILLLDEPTRGIDVGAKQEIYAIIRRLAAEGKAIVMASSELNEILLLSDRILVMCEGRVASELDPERITQEEIIKWALPK